MLPENSPAGQKLSGSGKRWAKMLPKNSPEGKLSGSGKRWAKMLPENSPAGQKLSGSGKRWAKMLPENSPAVERGAWNPCIHVKWGGNLGDLQGVVTLGVARDPKCIFPYRGAGFSEWAPPHVHAKRCTWPPKYTQRGVHDPKMYMPSGVHGPKKRWKDTGQVG